jgi:sirohydrochlorin ferrochelatase
MTLPPALILAHGQPSDPGPAAAELDALAARVAAFLPGRSVRAATLAEPGALDAALKGLAEGVVFPMFMAGGWFTRVQIPARLAAAGATGWRVLEPFGCDPGVHDLCVAQVRASTARAVILAAHGSFKSPAPGDIARHVAAQIATRTGLPVTTGFIDQAPQLAALTGFGPETVCLPFFAADGGHVSLDIPKALKEAGFEGRCLPPIGLDPAVPGLIARAIDRAVPVCRHACRWAAEAGA